jgi:hypothetical protein
MGRECGEVKRETLMLDNGEMVKQKVLVFLQKQVEVDIKDSF